MIIECSLCGKKADKQTGHVNRARKLGNNLYCSKECSSKGRRLSTEEKKKRKKEYDIKYREKNKEFLKEKNRKYNESPAGRAMQKRQREKRKEYHNAYCRKPEQRLKEKLRRYKRILGNDFNEKKKLCISCEVEKFILEFQFSSIFPDNRLHVCRECESIKHKKYGASTKSTINAMVNRRYSKLKREDIARHPYLIEANRVLISLKQLVNEKH